MRSSAARRPGARGDDGAGERGGRGDERSLSDAVRRVQRTTGDILGAERVPFDGRDINRVKYMDDRGRVRYMDDPHRRVHSRARRGRICHHYAAITPEQG